MSLSDLRYQKSAPHTPLNRGHRPPSKGIVDIVPREKLYASEAEKKAAYRARQKEQEQAQPSYDAGYARRPFEAGMSESAWCSGLWQSYADSGLYELRRKGAA
jgi:hypothetical protein